MSTILLFLCVTLITTVSCGQKNKGKNEADTAETVALNVIKLKADTALKNALSKQLLNIYEDDQKYRQQVEGTFLKYGFKSKEIKELASQMNHMDSLNLVKVQTILAQYGWLSPSLIGQDGNSALFLVIQHADAKTRLKYLPMIRLAVQNKAARASDLAAMEDRILTNQGKKQIYGASISLNRETGKYSLDPLEDPGHVDERRAKVGLGTLSNHLAKFGLVK
ncbi:hypothetical protein H7F33_13055 [Pedobacter sp. PAMC26386]|nr:hypothetical protein H7F33_13055 [Pedobacter sp. PAMC26386]